MSPLATVLGYLVLGSVGIAIVLMIAAIVADRYDARQIEAMRDVEQRRKERR